MLLSALPWLQLLLWCVSIAHGFSQGLVDLSAPIDLEKSLKFPPKPTDTRGESTPKAQIVVFNNRREARLPFLDPRKSNRRRIHDKFIKNPLSFLESLPQKINMNGGLERRTLEMNFNEQRIELERRQEIEREVKKALEKRNEILSNAHVRQKLSQVPDSYVDNTDFGHNGNAFAKREGPNQKDRRPISTWSKFQGAHNSPPRYGDKWTTGEFGDRLTDSLQQSSAVSNKFWTKDKPKEDFTRRKPPILIIEKIPVYIEKESEQTYDNDYKAPLDHYYDPNKPGGNDSPIDRRPGRLYPNEGDESPGYHNNEGQPTKVNEGPAIFSNSYDYENGPSQIKNDQEDIHSNDEIPIYYYDNFPPHTLPSSSIPYDPQKVGYEDVYYPQNTQEIGPAINLPTVLVQGQPLPHIIHDSIAEDSGLGPEQLELKRRLHAALAARTLTLRQQAIAGLALNQRLQQIAALQALQQQHHHQVSLAAAARARQTSDGVSDLEYSATTSDGSDRGITNRDQDDALKQILTSEFTDSINNQIKKHVDKIVTDDDLQSQISKEDLLNHLLRLRYVISNQLQS